MNNDWIGPYCQDYRNIWDYYSGVFGAPSPQINSAPLLYPCDYLYDHRVYKFYLVAYDEIKNFTNLSYIPYLS